MQDICYMTRIWRIFAAPDLVGENDNAEAV